MSRAPEDDTPQGGQTAGTGESATHHQASEIARLLFAIAYESRDGFERAATDFDLAPPQARALLSLDGPTPMSALAENLKCDASNITGIADRLEAQGLVERRPDQNDRRVKLLALTPDGLRLQSKLSRWVTETAPVTTRLSDTEREVLHGLLLKIAGPDAPTGCG